MTNQLSDHLQQSMQHVP